MNGRWRRQSGMLVGQELLSSSSSWQYKVDRTKRPTCWQLSCCRVLVVLQHTADHQQVRGRLRDGRPARRTYTMLPGKKNPTSLCPGVLGRCGMLSTERSSSDNPPPIPPTDYARRSYRVSSKFQQLPFVGAGAAVLDQWNNTVDNITRTLDNDRGILKTWNVPVTARAIALLHFAAVGGHPEAQLALGLR